MGMPTPYTDDAVLRILHRHATLRRRHRTKTTPPRQHLTASQFLKVSTQDVLLSMDLKTLRAVYECFVGQIAPPKTRSVLAATVLQMQRDLPQKVLLQEQFCADVDRVMKKMRLPLVSGLGDAVKVRHWFELIGRPVDACCKVHVSDTHMMLVDLECIDWTCPTQQEIIRGIIDSYINNFGPGLLYQSTLHLCVQRARQKLP